MHKKTLAVSIILVFLGLAFGFIEKSERVQEFPEIVIGLTEKDLGKVRFLWEQKIQRIGASAAYELFKKENEEVEYNRQHALAHIFGELVFEKEGIEGVAICDSSFGFGCFHSFFGKAIQERGVNVIQELDAACIKTYGPRGTGCSHGIGHGILSYTGEESLAEALELCAGLTFKGPIGGCSSGVFMEYNFKTMAATQGQAELRPLTAENRYSPCAETLLFKESCYFEAPAWWRSSLEQSNYPPEETYRTAGSWCVGIEDETHRDACLRGIGNVIPANAGYNLELSIRHCSFMPDRESELKCRKGAAWGFFAEPSRREQAVHMCIIGTKEDEKNTCLSEYQII